MIVLKKEDYIDFISTQHESTHVPLAIVSVTSNVPGHKDYVYETPPGFQFDKYVSSLFPGNSFRLQINPSGINGWKIEILGKTQEVIETHMGMFVV